MSSQELRQAAIDLAREIDAPSGEISVGTRLCGRKLELAVSLSPKIAHLARRVPHLWHGLKVQCQVADLASTFDQL